MLINLMGGLLFTLCTRIWRPEMKHSLSHIYLFNLAQ